MAKELIRNLSRVLKQREEENRDFDVLSFRRKTGKGKNVINYEVKRNDEGKCQKVCIVTSKMQKWKGNRNEEMKRLLSELL